MIDTRELEEFQYMYGDPRPFFHDYVISLPNIACYHHKQPKVHLKSFQFVCTKETNKRVLKPPSDRALKTLEDNIQNGNSPIICIPVLMKNKYRCKDKSNTKHACVILYNRLTHEVERLDIKRYHLSGYTIKVMIRELENEFMTKIVSQQDQHKDLKLIIDVDVPMSFIEKFKFPSARAAYPVFTLAYINVRSRFPRLPSDKVIEKVNKMKLLELDVIWQKYVDFRNTVQQQVKCKDGMVHNPESNKCIRPLSASFKLLLIEPYHKPCKEGKVYNTLLERCVPSNKQYDIDIMLPTIIKHSSAAGKQLTHIDKVAVAAMNLVMSQYPYAHFIFPRDRDLNNVKKNDYSIGWRYKEETQEFVLSMPVNYWDHWKEPMHDPRVRFIITYVTLVSNMGGIHANVFIYDKNTNEVERFDGLGQNTSVTYKLNKFDEAMRGVFAAQTIFKKPVKYLTPIDYCPKTSIFQSKELDDLPGADRRGNCAVWRLWYIHVRLANPHLKRNDVIKMASNKLKDVGSFHKFIKSFQAYILHAVEHNSK